MYGAILLALLTAFCWPERNISDVPFSELTLKMIAGTIFALWLGYHALTLAFSSLEKDSFWPWKWTLRIFAILSIRAALLVGLGIGLVVLSSARKIGPLLMEHYIVSGIAIFICVTMIVCTEDDELVGPNFLRKRLAINHGGSEK